MNATGSSVVDVSLSQLVVAPAVAVAGVDAVGIEVLLRDSNGDFVMGEVVLLSATGTDNDLGTLTATNLQGESSTTWTSTKAETKTLTATLSDSTLLGTADVTFIPGPPSQLRFSQQPLGNEAGGPFGSTVAVEDAFANPVTAGTVVISLQIANNPGAASLGGQTTIASAAGTAPFTGLAIVVPGTGYTLRASATGLSDAVSAPFDIVPGDPAVATSTMAAAPHSNDADGVSLVVISVTLRNQYNIPLTSYPVSFSVSGTGNVLTPTSGNTDGLGVLGATLSSTAAEPKVITATAGPIMLTSTVYFYPPACTLLLPTRPKIRFASRLNAFAAVDVDGDGEVDSIEANESGMVVVRRGRGDGRFHAPVESVLNATVRSLYSADFNGDGDLDLLALSENASAMSVLRGNGDGTFAAEQVTSLGESAFGAAIADFDQDSKLDVVVALPGVGRLDFFKGVGDGTFVAPTAISTALPAVDVVAADLDVNGAVDLVAATGSQVIRLMGNGNGTFGSAQASSTNIASPTLRIAKLNADIYPDVIVLATGSDGIGALLGSSTGALSVTWLISTGVFAPGLATGDFDADGDSDFVLARAPLLLTFRSNGDGTFTRTNDYATDACGAGSGLWRGGLATADVDGDPYLDVISACSSLGVIMGAVGGKFVAPITYAGSQSILFDTIADFNGDTRQDLAAYSVDDGNRAWLTQANGSLLRGSAAMSFMQPSDGATADLNSDNKADLVVVQAGQFLAEVGLGNGNGTFQAATNVAFPSLYATGIELADIDNDGKPDMILLETTISQRGVHVAKGNGLGGFGAFTRYATTADPRKVIARDFDGDGDRDMIVVAGTLAIYTNSGTGTFSLGPQLQITGGVSSVALGDFNGDSALDLAALSSTITVFAGPGLTAIGSPYALGTPAPSQTYALETADLDDDGTLDLVASTLTGFWVLQGYPDGYFRAARPYGYGNFNGITIGAPPVLTDLNSDGAIDVAFASGKGIAVGLQGTCISYSP